MHLHTQVTIEGALPLGFRLITCYEAGAYMVCSGHVYEAGAYMVCSGHVYEAGADMVCSGHV